MVARIKQKIFQKIHGGNLVYNTCWEDPHCDRALLDFDHNSRIVMLTSAGCNALDYLLDNPISVDCVDVNPRQNALLELKIQMIQLTDHSTLFEWFGNGQSKTAKKLFHDTLSGALSEYSKDYWERHLHFFSGSGLRRSFYWYGSAGSAAFLLNKRIQSNDKAKQSLRALLESENLDQQRAFYENLEPQILDAFTRWMLNRHVFQSMLGVPQIQQKLAKQQYKEGMAGYIRACLQKVFAEQSITDNYFWKVYLNGHYDAECCPNYLKKDQFHVLKKRVQRINTHHCTLSEYLKNHPGKYTHFILLDHQDWMAEHNMAALEEEWQCILENSAPGAKYLLRSAAENIAFIPDFVQKRVDFVAAHNIPSIPFDRVGTYASTLRGILKPQ